MDTQIILIYCLCDDLLKAMRHREDVQCRMGDAEVMTVALVGRMLWSHGYMRMWLDKSRFSRRLYRIKRPSLTLFALLGERVKAMNAEAVYILDSFPIAACDNVRIPRSNRYFYVIKVHLLVTPNAELVEFFFTPARAARASPCALFSALRVAFSVSWSAGGELGALRASKPKGFGARLLGGE